MTSPGASDRTRMLFVLALASCAGGEGGASVTATVQLQELSCEVPDPTTLVSRGTIDVFVREVDATLRVFTGSNAFPLDGGLTVTTVTSCGAWRAEDGGCVPVPGASSRQTMSFETTVLLDGGFTLPDEVTASVEAFVTTDVGDLLATDMQEVACP